MTPEREYIQTLLQDLQEELTTQGLWTASPPDPDALDSTEPFCVDTLPLEQWLQFVFLGRMTAILEQGAPLPETCAIEPYAQKQFSARHNARTMLRIIGKLDIMITRAT
ncbi:MAG: YqcC family protein [Natronospirillum sp.]